MDPTSGYGSSQDTTKGDVCPNVSISIPMDNFYVLDSSLIFPKEEKNDPSPNLGPFVRVPESTVWNKLRQITSAGHSLEKARVSPLNPVKRGMD